MRVNGDASTAIIVLLCVCFLAWFLWVIFGPILRAIGRWLSGAEAQAIPDREAARKLLETPVPTSDPKMWVRYKCEPELCPAPQALIHVPSDAEHRATCARCQEEWQRSGRRQMPHATN